MQITHYKPAPGLGGETIWPVGDSPLQRKKTERILSTSGVWAPGEVLDYSVVSFCSLPSLCVSESLITEEVARLSGLCLLPLALCLWP